MTQRRRILVFALTLLGVLMLPLLARLVQFGLRWHEFDPYLPPRVHLLCQVTSRPPVPEGVPKSIDRRVRELLGLYYRPYRTRYYEGSAYLDADGTVLVIPKRNLEDTLMEFGAHVKDGKLCDATGGEIRIMKGILRPGRIDDWSEEYKALEKQYTVFVVHVDED